MPRIVVSFVKFYDFVWVLDFVRFLNSVGFKRSIVGLERLTRSQFGLCYR